MADAIALVDMDGTLCDFDGAMQSGLESLRGPDEDPRLSDLMYEDIPYIKARRKLIKSQPGFWRNLKPFKLGFDILEELDHLKFSTFILTKGPKHVDAAWTEKKEWCRQHVPHLPIIMSEDKGLVYGKVLVDDWPLYIDRWLERRPRGLVIAPAHTHNVGIEEKYPNNVIRYDGSNMDQVRLRLVKIRATVIE